MKRACSSLFVSWLVQATLCSAASGCAEIPASAGEGDGGGTDDEGGAPAGGAPAVGAELAFDASTNEPVYVDLDGPAIVGAGDSWELRFEGLDVFTNGGASGSGESRAFGPLSAITFLADEVPSNIPFLISDEPGGAFLDWYAYDGTTHALFSRYHVVGVRRGEALYKVQVLGYYGEEQGAPISALYQVRSARVGPGGVGPTVVWENIDATAGGASPTESDPSGCVVLESQERLMLTPDEARASARWDLCFRRDTISVNGGDGGPGGVAAVDLDAELTATETLAEVTSRSAQSELSRFDAVDHEALAAPGLDYRGDGIVSAFSGHWLELGAVPLAPHDATWLVAGADGDTPFFVVFEDFEGATATSVGTIHARIKTIGGSLP